MNRTQITTIVRLSMIPCALVGALALSACDPNEIIPPKKPGPCDDAGATTLCQPAATPSPDPGNIGG